MQDGALPLLAWLRFRLERLAHLWHRSEALGAMGVFRRAWAKLQRQPQHHGLLRVEPDTSAHTNLPPILRQVRIACERAFADYKPPRHMAHVTFFRSPERRPYFCDPLIVWQRKAASVTIIDVPGDHGMMMLEPNVAVLAAEVARCLAPGAGPAPAESVSKPEPERAADAMSDGGIVTVTQPRQAGTTALAVD